MVIVGGVVVEYSIGGARCDIKAVFTTTAARRRVRGGVTYSGWKR